MTAAFTLSLDLELAWGEFYRRPVDVPRLLEVRRRLPELLGLLDRRRIRATFAVVGHLLLESCSGHDELPRASLSWRQGDWYDSDPRTDEGRDPAWYGASLVRAIAAASPGHDLGAHGFSHLPLRDPGVTAEVATAEFQQCRRALAGCGLQGGSFVYPKNAIKYTELLQRNGFDCYRDVDGRWYAEAAPVVRKAAHMGDQILAVSPPVGRPRIRDGVVEAPSSMLFLSREGFRRWIPMSSRVTRARRGLERAIRQGAVFHLWLHVEDLVPDSERMLAGLDAVLTDVERGCKRGEVQVLTMADLARTVPR